MILLSQMLIKKEPQLQTVATVERFEKDKSIPTKIADGLITSNQRSSKFYISPKIHKENNPGRPVIRSINCHTSKISKYVDYPPSANNERNTIIRKRHQRLYQQNQQPQYPKRVNICHTSCKISLYQKEQQLPKKPTNATTQNSSNFKVTTTFQHLF